MAKILAIDDNNDNLISLKAIIDDTFPEAVVFTALNGTKGIELAIANNPDVILLDIIMPDMDGFEVCRRLKLDDRIRDIPVVFLTALKGDKENRIKALEVGAEGFLSKPIDEIELIAQIRAMVKIKAASEQKRDEKVNLEKLVEERTNELLQSQAQLKGIFENLQDAYFQADLSGKFTLVSPSALKMYGYRSVDELFVQSAELLYFNPKERHSLISILRTEGQIKDYVSQGRKKDGSAFWVSMNIQWLWSKDGQIIGTEGVVRDITERIKTEKALSESEEKYRLMVDLLPDGVIIHEGGKVVFANAAALKSVGADSFDQLIERPLMDYVHPDFKDISLDRIKEIYSAGRPSKFSEEKFITLKGEIIDVEVIGIPILYMGKPAIQTIIRDITERKKVEAVLKESEERFRHISSSISDISYSCINDSKGNSEINWLYGATEKITGYTIDELFAMKCWGKLIIKEDFPIFKSHVLEVLPGKSETCQLRLKRKDGNIVWIQANAECVKDPKGSGFNILYGGLIDITDRKLAEDELHENVARLELAMSTANMSWWEMDMTNGHVIFERRKAEMLGYAPEKFKHYTDFMNLVHPEDYEHTMDAMRSHLNGSMDKYEVEYRIKAISGEYKWFYDIASVTKRDSEGGPLIVSGLVLNISERKHLGEELQNSFDMLEKLAAQVPGVVYQYRLYPDGRSAFPFSSPGMFGIYEVTPDEVREDASPVFSRIHPDDYDYIVETITESARNQTNYQSEFRVILPKQGLRWRMSSAKPELLEDGSTLWHGIITDITERKQNEEALLEREQLFKGLFNASPDAIVLMATNHPTISWPIVDCNEAACRMNGYTREEMIGHSIDLLHAPKEILEERDIYYNDLKKEGILLREHIHRHKDGHIFPIESSTTIVTVGGHEMVLGIDRDITDRKQAEVELIEKNTFIQTILDNLPIGVALNSIDNGIALYMNKKFEEIYGWTSQEIKDITEFFQNVYPDENYRNELISTIMTDIQSGDPQRMHWENIFVTRKDCSQRVVNAVNIPLVEQNTMVSTVSDITELHKSQIDLVAAKEKAEESDRLKSAFLANMSHEIRTPLNSIIGFSELMADSDFDAGQQTEFAKIIINNGNSLLSIINDIMDFSKIEAGQIVVYKLPFVVHKLIYTIQKECSIGAQEKGIELRIDPLNPKEDVLIKTDENRLRQVLINLVSNAIKFTKEGYVELGFKVTGDCVQFHVSDSGIGISEEYHDKIFERFRQVESAESRKYGGNGLGLAISKSLVEMMGGEIWLESVHRKGSTFFFTVPIGLITN